MRVLQVTFCFNPCCYLTVLCLHVQLLPNDLHRTETKETTVVSPAKPIQSILPRGNTLCIFHCQKNLLALMTNWIHVGYEQENVSSINLNLN